ncbi:hypothetical protein MMPV_002678 [Pyropia vietnamensis]
MAPRPPPLYPVDTIVWAKVPGFAWWPARVAETSKTHVKKGVQFIWVLFFNDTNNAWVHPKNIALLSNESADMYMVKSTHKSYQSIEQAFRMAMEELAESPHPPALQGMAMEATAAAAAKSKSAPTTPTSAKGVPRGTKRRASSATAAKPIKPSKRKRQGSLDEMGDSDSAGDAVHDDQELKDSEEVPVADKDESLVESAGVERRLSTAAEVDAEVDAEIEEAHSKAAEKQLGGSRPSRSKRLSSASGAVGSTPKPPKLPKSSKEGKVSKGDGPWGKRVSKADAGTSLDDVPVGDEPVVPLKKKKSRGSEPSGAPGATVPASTSAQAADTKEASSEELSDGKGDAHAVDKGRQSGGGPGVVVPLIDPPPTYELVVHHIHLTTTELLEYGADPEKTPPVPDVAHWDKMHKTTTVDELAEGVQAIDEAGVQLGAAIEVLSTTRTNLQAASDKVTLATFGNGCLKDFEEAYAAHAAAVKGRADAEDKVARAVRDVIAAKVTVGMLKHSQAGKPVRRLFKRYRSSSKPVDFLCSMLITQWMGIIENSQRESPSDKEHARDAKDVKASSKSRDSKSAKASKSGKDKDSKKEDVKEELSSASAKAEASTKADAKESAKNGNGVVDEGDSEKDVDGVGTETKAAADTSDAKDGGEASKGDAAASRDSPDGDATAGNATDKAEVVPPKEKQSSPLSADRCGADIPDNDAMDTSETPAKPDDGPEESDGAVKGSAKVKGDAKKSSSEAASTTGPGASSPKDMEVDEGPESKPKSPAKKVASASDSEDEVEVDVGDKAGDDSVAAHDRSHAKQASDDDAKASDGGSDD